MKKTLAALAIIMTVSLTAASVQAQVRVGININIGQQPPWRLSGYDYVEYYYLPEIECYYNVPQRQFIHLSNGRWVFSASLPARYRNYNLYTGYKVVVNRPRAYRYFEQDRRMYGRYEARHDNGRHNGRNKGRKHHH